MEINYKKMVGFFACLFLCIAGCKSIYMSSLHQSNLTSSALTVWASEAAVAANTYSYLSYKKDLQQSAEYFTPAGFHAYQLALTGSKTLANVAANKLVVSAVPTDTPVILNEGVVNNVYTWQVQVPLLVTYENADKTMHKHMVANMTIIRVPAHVRESGVGINQFTLTPIPTIVKHHSKK